MGADHQRRLAKKVARKAKVRERRLERELEEQRIEKPALTWGLHLTDLEKAQSHADKCILRVEDVSVSYGARTVLRGVDLSLYGKDRVALLGTNGAGKSTVLRCITGRIPYVGTVRLGAGVRPGFLTQDSEDLPLDMPVLDLFRARVSVSEEEARTYLHKFLFAGGEVFKPASALSYGQRSKLALAVMLASEANFLLLDEPTAHMDIPALSAIEEALSAYAGPLLVVSHDRYFIERINVTRIVALRDGRVIEMDSMEMYERSLMTP
jgi:ATP-binding cassette subfamily F protein 3